MRTSVTLGRPAAGPRRTEDEPFRILIVGHFGGTAEAARPLAVDVDSLDAAMERLRVTVAIPQPPGGEAFVLDVADLAGLHPDRLLRTVPALRSLADLRAGLLDPVRYGQAAALARAMLASPAAPAPASTASPAPGEQAPAGETDDQALERLLGRPRSRPDAPVAPPVAAAAAAGVDALVRQALPDEAIVRPNAERESLVAAVEAELAARLRAVLRDPAFRSVEAAWRGMDVLVRALETGADLQLFVLDRPPDRLAADSLAEAGPWAAVVVLRAFGPGAEDVALLGRLAELASALDTVCLASADLAAWDAVNVLAPPGAWVALRRSAAAARVGLAGPGFMLRPPYGPRSEVIDTFAFEEIAGVPRPADYLWGNPAVLCACLLGQAFTEAAWAMEPGNPSTIDDLPSHAFRHEGESRITAAVERRLTDRQAERLLSLGIMPILPGPHATAARLARFQSLAHPPRELVLSRGEVEDASR